MWHRASSRKVADSIPERVIGHNLSGLAVALGSTPPLTEMSTRNISWGLKAADALGLTTLSPSCADCLEIWEPQTPGTLRACPGLFRDCFTFTFTLAVECTELWHAILMFVDPWILV